MIQKFKRPISILLALLMVAGIFTALPFTVSAAEGDKVVFFTDSGNWNNVSIYAWDSEGAQTNGNSWPGPNMGYLFNNSDGQKVYGAIVSSSTVGIIFSNNGNPQTGDITGFQDGDWWWWNNYAVQVDRNDYEVVAAQAPTANSDGHKKYYKLGNYYIGEDLSVNETGANIIIPATGVAAIGNTKYESIAAAVEAAAASGDTITILKNCSIDAQVTIPANKAVTIDFNGYVVDVNVHKGIVNNGSLTLCNSTTNTAGGMHGVGKGGLVDSTGTLTINSGVYTSDNVNGNDNSTCAFYIHGEGSTATVNGGTIETVGYGIYVYTKGTVTVNAGTITSIKQAAISGNGNSGNGEYEINVKGGTLSSTNSVAIYHPNNGTLAITGGTITGKTAIYIKSGATNVATSTTSIDGATITGNGAAADYAYNGNGCNPTGDAIVIDNCGYPGAAPSIAITGGTITSVNNKAVASYASGTDPETGDEYEPITGFVSGGTFNTPVPEEYCATGFIPTANGSNYGVKTGAYVAQVGETKYETFAAAVAARTSKDDVITLIKAAGTYTGDADEFPIKVAKDGKSVTVKVNGAYIVSSSTADGVSTYTVTEAAIEYTTLAGAVSYKSNIDYSNMGSSGTYKLLKDVTANSRIVPGMFASNVTVDLNGHTLTSTATDQAFRLTRAGSASSHNTFTLTDTSTNGGGKLVANSLANSSATVNDSSVIVASGNYNDITISNVIIEATQGIGLIGTNQTLTIDNCDITITGDDYALSTNGSLTNGAVITVTDSSIESTNDIGVYLPGGSTATFTDTDVTGTTAIYQKSGSLTINGGTITGTGAAAEFTHNGNGANATGDAIVIESCNYPNGTPTTSIGNTTLASTNGVQVGDYTYGEAAAADVTATSNEITLPEGLKWVETATEGVYEVAPDYVASVNGSGYMTFAEAVDARTSKDDVITLIKAAGTYTAEASEFPIKVAKDGKSVTVKVNGAYLVSSSTADGVTTYTVTEAAIEYTSTNGTVSYKSNLDYTNISSNGTYKLLKDITLNSRIAPGVLVSNITIDLNGHTMSSNATDYVLLLSRAGSATAHKQTKITDSSTNGGGKIVANSLANTGTANNTSVISASGSYNDITIENVTIETTKGIALIGNNQTLTIDNCNIKVTGNDFALSTNGSLTNGAVINVTDSSITATNEIAVYLPGGATSTFTDTDVTGTTAMYIKSGNTTIDGGTYTATGAAAEFTHSGNGANATGDAIVIESCNYPNGVPTVSIGADDVVSAHGKQVGDYNYGEAPLGEVTATSNTMTLPAGLSWIETETPGVYTVGHVHEYNDWAFNWTQDATTGDWTCNKLTLTCSCGDTQEYDVTGFFGASVVTCTANNDGSFTYSVSKKVGDRTFVDTEELAANGVIKSVTQLKAAAKKGGEWELGANIEKGVGISCANGFVLDGKGHTVTRSSEVVTNAVFVAANKNASFTLKNLTIDGIAPGVVVIGEGDAAVDKGKTESRPAIASYQASGNSGNVINLENVEIINYDFDADNNGVVLAWGEATVNMKNCGIATDSTYDVWAGAAAKVNIDGGTYGNIYINGGTSAVTVNGVNDSAQVAEITLGGSTAKVTVNNGTVNKITANFEIPKEAVVIDYVNASVQAPEGYEWVDSATEGMKTLAKKLDLFVGHDISLGGDIGVNFYINPDYANIQNAIVKFSVDNGHYIGEVSFANATPVVEKGYKATFNVPAAYMAHKITAQVYLGDTLLGKEEYSVEDYAKVILANPDAYLVSTTAEKKAAEKAALIALVQEMLNYGAKAKAVFASQMKDQTVEYSPISGYTMSNDVTAAKIEAAIKAANSGALGSDLKATAEELGAKLYGTSVVYLSECTLRVIFAKRDGNLPGATKSQSNFYYLYDKKPIAAAELDKQQNFTAGEVSFHYSALDYAKSIVETSNDANAVQLAKSLYLYNQAAKAYFKAKG